MPSIHKADRRQIAKIAANTSWANTTDAAARTQPARDSFLRRFDDQVDPERRLSPQERAKRAEAAKKAYFASLALKSARSRRRGTVQDLDEAAAPATSGISVEQVAASAQALTAEQRSELAALLLTGGGRT